MMDMRKAMKIIFASGNVSLISDFSFAFRILVKWFCRDFFMSLHDAVDVQWFFKLNESIFGDFLNGKFNDLISISDLFYEKIRINFWRKLKHVNGWINHRKVNEGQANKPLDSIKGSTKFFRKACGTKQHLSPLNRQAYPKSHLSLAASNLLRSLDS